MKVSYRIFTPVFIMTAFVFVLQTIRTFAQDKKVSIELEADPLAYLLQGYSFHAGVTYNNFRSSVGVFGIEQPDFVLENDAFSVYSSGFDAKTDYLFTGLKGVHAGLQLTYARDRLRLKDTGEDRELWGLNIGLRAGYRLMLGRVVNQYKGLYINPWLAIIYTPNTNHVIIGTEEYEQPSFSLFPAIHVGWRF